MFGRNEVDFAKRDVFVISLSSSGSQSVKIECFLVNEISSITNEHVEILKKDYSHLQRIHFSDVAKDEDFLKVDILVGSEFIWEFQKGQSIRGGPNEPIAVKTTLGWVLSGPLKISKSSETEYSINLVSSAIKDKQLEECLYKLWDLDTLGIRENDEVHTNLVDDIAFKEDRYSVSLPWKVGHKDLPRNYDVCYARLQGLLKKLKKGPETLGKYNEVIQDQLQTGIIERLSKIESAEEVHYLPTMQ